MGIDRVEVDDVMTAARSLLDGIRQGASEDPEALNLIASALLAAADTGDGDLDLAVELLERSLTLTGPDHLDRPARVGNLASVLIDRFERGLGSRDDLVRAVELARGAVEDLDEADPRQLLALNVLTNGLKASWQYLGGEESLHEALDHLPLLAAHVRVAGPWAHTFAENAALLAFDGARTFRDDQSDGLLAFAIELQGESIAGVNPRSYTWATRRGALGGMLAERYHRSTQVDDLEAALDAASDGVTGARAVPHEWAIHAMTLGNLLHQQFLRSGRVSLLDDSARLHRQALDALVEDAPGTAAFLNNVSIVAHDRYARFGRLEDLRQAVESIERAVAASPYEGRDQCARYSNAASTLLDLYRARGGTTNLDRAADLARRGVEIGDRVGAVDTTRVCLGTLSDILQARATTSKATEPTGASTALESLRFLWAARSDDLLSGEGAVLAQRLIRRARLPTGVAGDVDRLELLTRAVRYARTQRPAVVLAAAREALGVVLEGRLGGNAAVSRLERGSAQPSASLVDDLADAAFEAMAELVEMNADWDGSLSWLRDARGTGALVAQLRLMDGDPAGAVSAFESGHALLLARVGLAEITRTQPGRASDAATFDSAMRTKSVDREHLLYVWATAQTGGTVLTASGTPKSWGVVPALGSAAVEAMRALLARASHEGSAAVDDAVEEVGTWLGQVLPPHEDVLRSERPSGPDSESELRLAICAGGVLASLPWAAARFPSDGALLDDHVVLSGSPTGSVSRRCAVIAARWLSGEFTRDADVLSLAAPAPSRLRELEHAASEGLAFAGPGGLVSGAEATCDLARVAQREVRVLHVACHGLTVASNPLENHLVLAHDERWYAHDIITRDRSPRLVVLSACETATVEGLHADEGLGLASAFLAAGTPGVVASLWSVGDAAAARFVGEAAPGLRDPKQDPAVVLRRSRAAQRAAGVGGSGWAAFTMVGR
ncbi:CHAT domain-containing protein [Ornithinimicrobium cerasi]|uniref:CHAT domain-containing protein n=2 Tax=Ornithinimicrobium cerasi TaxID=2248773 RepID=A0A285VMU8_9MICO|nr:CHAT domain-containing protein [Ornithinimicrobium cerasi]